MPRIKLTLEYDGTHYVGWQLQENGPSLQGRVQRALAELLGQPTTTFSAGRTDSGVHALGQVIHLDSPKLLPMKAYWMGLNGLLPEDIAVVAAEEVDPGFDARFWASGKRYRYRISNRRSRSPLRHSTHWEIFHPLDVAAMQAAAPLLVGEHDFGAFRAADCQSKTTVRTMRKVFVTGLTSDEIAVEVEGTAFLKHMVRNFVGTLAEVGRGRKPPAWVGEVLATKDRTQAGPTAPAHGLTLVEVLYGDRPRLEDPEDE